MGIFKKSYNSWVRDGVSRFTGGDFGRAIECFDQALQINPHVPDTWQSKGACLIQLKAFEAAQICFTKAIQLAPKDQSSWYNLGLCLQSLGKYQEAISCYQKTVEINPKHSKAFNNEGVSWMALNKPKEACKAFDNGLAIDHRNLEAWYNKATLLQSLGRHKEAIECFLEVKVLSPDNSFADAWIAFSNWYLELETLTTTELRAKGLENYKEAFPFLLKALDMKHLGRYQEALENLDKVIELTPDNPELREMAITNRDQILPLTFISE